MDKLKVAELKDYAKSIGCKLPLGLKKNDIIKYLEGFEYEQDNGINSNRKFIKGNINELEPRYMNFEMDWKEHLFEHGWAVVKLDNWREQFVDDFFQWLSSCCERFDKNNRETWIANNLPVMYHGIIKSYFGHTELQWQIRELCVSIFADLWNCEPEELLCSFDGGCFLTNNPPLKNGEYSQWIHVDQRREDEELISVQGIVNFVNNEFEDGGLVLVENSFKIFNEYMLRHPTDGIVWGPADITDPLLSSLSKIKICAPAGSIILFDSRNFHCNVPPFHNSTNFRMCTYVCMQPRIGANQTELNKRTQAYKNGRMTSHACYGPWFKINPAQPHTYGTPHNKPPTIEIVQLTPLRSRLIGF